MFHFTCSCNDIIKRFSWTKRRNCFTYQIKEGTPDFDTGYTGNNRN